MQKRIFENLSDNPIKYQMCILEELQKLEGASEEYYTILKMISKRIRKDLWQIGKNDKVMCNALVECGAALLQSYREQGEYTEDIIIDYVNRLRTYYVFLGVKLDKFYFDKFVSDIKLENARVIIEKQWDDIIHSSAGSLKSFLEIFDDFFTKCIDKYRDVFLYPISEKDVLCRVVKGWGHDTKRFIPWDNKDTINRWNPPDKTYLYLSFEKEEKKYSASLSLNEYICLEEYRAKIGEQYSFCHFKIENRGKILDLSYSDIELWKIEKALDLYGEVIKDLFVEQTLSNPQKMKKIGSTQKSVKRYIRKNINRKTIDRSIVEISVAKQYLKMVCNTIYKKVDENDDIGKEKAYKSFHILAEYLESKGITGIIYPCTRTNKVKGKNLVLFNRYDAIPIEGSIREIIYE